MTTTNQRAVEELLRELASDCEVAYGVTEQSYRQFCDSGARGRMPNDTWAEHCQRRKQQIEQAIATLRTPGWRPISEAPRDGTAVWLFCPDDYPQQAVGYWADDPRGSYWAFAEQLVMDVAGMAYPTHFMPLPPPPGEG